MRKVLPIIFILIFSGHYVSAQEPVIEWQHVYDSLGATTFFDIQKTPENRFLLAGCSDADKQFTTARIAGQYVSPALVFTIDSTGDQKQFYVSWPGISSYYSVIPLPGNKCIGAGYDWISGGSVLLEKVPVNAGTGTADWSKKFGGSLEDRAYSLQATNDNGLVFAGYTYSTDGDVTGNHGSSDMWIGKCDGTGNLQWQKCIGGTAADTAFSIIQLADGSYLIAGTTTSNNGDVTANAGNADAWLVKLDASGTLVWQKTFGGSGNDGFKKLQVANDGGIIAVGYTYSNDGIVNNNHGNADVWVVKCDNTGVLQWQKCYGGSAEERGNDIKPVDGGGYLINGYSRSADGDVRINYGQADQWIVKIMNNGVIEWAKTIGTANGEYGTAILPVGQFQVYAVATREIAADPYRVSVVTKLGPLNEVTGSVFVDENANGLKDASEPSYNNATVKSTRTDGVSKSSGIVNGRYSNSLDTGTYQTALIFQNAYFTVDPVKHVSVFNSHSQHDTVNFRLLPIAVTNDLQVSMVPLTAARPGFQAVYRIIYKNRGTAALSNTVIQLNKDAHTDVANTIPAYTSLSGNTLSWNIGSLPVLGEGSIDVGLTIQPPPTVNNGDTLKFFVNGTTTEVDNTPGDNTDTLVQVTRGSFDPNDKTESHGGIISPAQISGADPLTYLIRFQNTGSDTAFTVTVRDTLESRLDWSSLQMISASHPYQLSIEDGNKLTWKFSDIKLPYSGIDEPNSHGYIAYRINPKPTVLLGDTIKNTAGIYFDYNLPVATNVEKTVVFMLSALPVTLTSFNAVKNGSAVQVNWKTALEENIDRFEVQRSANGINFKTIGTVAPGKTVYLFKDEAPLTGYNYYRLRSVDKDGALSYSSVVLVNLQSNTGIIAQVYPNPAKGNVTLKLQGAIQDKISVQLIDQQGRPIFLRQFDAQQTNELVIPLNTGTLTAGQYVLQIIVGEKTYLQKLILQ